MQLTPSGPRRRKKRWSPIQIHHGPLHQVLWEGTDRSNRIVVHLGEFGRRFEVSPDYMRRHIHEMVDEGRLRRVGVTGAGGVVRYEVADPKRYNPRDPNTWVRRSGPRWG